MIEEVNAVTFIKDVGFPIAVVAWLLYDRYKRDTLLTRQFIEKLDKIVEQVTSSNQLIKILYEKEVRK